MKIAHIGNLANLGAINCFFLRKMGVDAHLYVNERQSFQPVIYAEEGQDYSWVHTFPRKNNFHYFMTHTRLSFEFIKYDLVHSWTASLLPMAELALKFFGKRYLANATGSDLREAALGKGFNGYRIRRHFKNAAVVSHAHDTQTLDVASKLELGECELLKIPVADLSDSSKERLFPEPDPIFFSPSRLHIRSNQAHEVFMKNNDRFIRAFARFIHGGGRARLVLVDHGDNRKEVYSLIEELGISSFITWMNRMSQSDLVEVYRRCDVIVDQFNDVSYPVPGGGITFESMACGKPLILSSDEDAVHAEYGEVPPNLTCRTEDEILSRIESCADLSMLRERGKACLDWVLKHHGWELLTTNLINTYKENIL